MLGSGDFAQGLIPCGRRPGLLGSAALTPPYVVPDAAGMSIRHLLLGRLDKGGAVHPVRPLPPRHPKERCMTTNEKVKGPASYFPSIEKQYGKPVEHWFEVLDAVSDRKHMEQVALLKTEHKMGHGHANALVAYHKAKRGG
jgi:hypothetical protein